MKYNIFNKSNRDLKDLMSILPKFLAFTRDVMGYDEPVSISFVSDSENAKNLFGKTGYYDPSDSSITIYADNRHSKDILRSLSHELVHHAQNCNGKFDNTGPMGPGYAQNNQYMRNMEIEAYKIGNLCLRDFEDQNKQFLNEYNYFIKGVNTMNTKQWKNTEINNLLMERWNYKNKINEARCGGVHEDEEELNEDVPKMSREEAEKKFDKITHDGPGDMSIGHKGGKTTMFTMTENRGYEQKVRGYVREALQERLKNID